MAVLPRLLGMLLLLVPVLPLARWFPVAPDISTVVSPSEWLLGIFIAGTLAWLAALVVGRWLPDAVGRWTLLQTRSSGWLPAALLALLAILLLIVSWDVFRHRPLLADSIAQLFQAIIFAGGDAVAPLPPGGGFFTVQQMVEGTAGWYAQYPPGHSALLAVGIIIGAPWIIPILLTLGSGGLLFLFAREAYDRRTAILTLGLLLLAPFFWFMGASFMNHVSALFLTCLALYLLARWERGGATLALVGAAAAVGGVFVIRPVDALVLGGVLGGWAAWRCLRARQIAALALAAAAGLTVGSSYLLWNALTTGDPFLPGYLELWGQAHGLGFHEAPTGEAHTPITGLRNQLTDLALLNLFLFEWPIPALLPVGLYFALGWHRGTWDGLGLAMVFAIPAAYFFYWHRDAYLGPRFLYGTIAFLVPLTARAILTASERLRHREWGAGGLRVNARAFVLSLLVVSFGYSVLYGTPQRFRVYTSGMASLKVDLASEAREAGIENGLIFVAVSWGNRLITELRALGVPPAEVEKAYRRVDHCDLHQLVSSARSGGWSTARTVAELHLLQAETDPRALIVTPELNGDRTLRIRADRPLDDECRDQVLYDREGFANLEPHLLVNRPTLDGPFVVARDLRAQNPSLRAVYSDRPAFVWRGGEFEALP